MFDRVKSTLNYFLTHLGLTSERKRPIDECEEEHVNGPSSKQRRIEGKSEHFLASEQFLCPAPNWTIPKKRKMASCRQQLRSVPLVHQNAPQPGCSWFEESKENIIEVSDDEDVEALAVWQDANTLRKHPLHKEESHGKKPRVSSSALSTSTKSNNDGGDDDDDDDIEVIKMVQSHKEEVTHSGNTISIFQTPSSRVTSLNRHLTLGSSGPKRTPVLLERLKSSQSKLSQGSSARQSSTSSRSSRLENQRARLALNESFRLEEKMQYSELLQKFTDVPLQARCRHGIWSPRIATPNKWNEGLQCTNSLCVKKIPNKESTIVIDLTKPQSRRSISTRHIEVRREREVEPSSSASRDVDTDEPKYMDMSFFRTNSLAEALKASDVCREDHLASIHEKYKKKREAREKQEKEEKLKASHFQKRDKELVMEVALERITKYLKITDNILEEDVEEEKVKLPELTPEMKKVINDALIPKPPSEVLVDAFGLPIKRHDMQTLAGLHWLNDEVINFYMELLKERGKLENYPSVYTFNTFFYPRLVSGGHAVLKRWTRKVDIFSYDLLIVPVHLGVHWCMAAINFRDKTVKYYDSMGSPNNMCLEKLLQYLKDESLDKKNKPFDASGWKTINVQDIPQQMNGSDCGMFSCMYAEYICRNADITFTQQDMPYFRHKMVYEIMNRRLLM